MYIVYGTFLQTRKRNNKDIVTPSPESVQLSNVEGSMSSALEQQSTAKNSLPPSLAAGQQTTTDNSVQPTLVQPTSYGERSSDIEEDTDVDYPKKNHETTPLMKEVI